MTAGVAIFVASGAFLFSLDLERPDRTAKSASAKPPILGLDDPATKRAEQRETARRPKVVPCKEAQTCNAGELAWCDLDTGLLACCPGGRIATPTKTCVCPPGGSASDPACTPAAGAIAATSVLDRKREKFALCHESASRRAPVGDVTLAFSISAEGVPYDIVVTTTGAKDATFEDCMSAFIEELAFSPPFDGHEKVHVPWAFTSKP